MLDVYVYVGDIYMGYLLLKFLGKGTLCVDIYMDVYLCTYVHCSEYMYMWIYIWVNICVLMLIVQNTCIHVYVYMGILMDE